MARIVELVAEDTAIVQLMESAVEQFDHAEVIVAGNPEDAAQLAVTQRPALVIIDSVGSDITNAAASARRIRANPETEHIPLAGLCPNVETGQRIISEGAEAFLVKPFDLEDLIALVEVYTLSARRAA